MDTSNLLQKSFVINQANQFTASLIALQRNTDVTWNRMEYTSDHKMLVLSCVETGNVSEIAIDRAYLAFHNPVYIRMPIRVSDTHFELTEKAQDNTIESNIISNCQKRGESVIIVYLKQQYCIICENITFHVVPETVV